MRCGLVMSATISRSTRTCAPVSVKGRCSLSAVVSLRRFTKVMPSRALRSSWLARRCRSCTHNSSSNASRARPRSASFTLPGRWTSRSASGSGGTPAAASTEAGSGSVTCGSSVSSCASTSWRSSLVGRPSVAGYTASTRPPAVPASSAPRFTNSRGASWRPWNTRTGPLSSSTSPTLMVRSRCGCPGQPTSRRPLGSWITAWKIFRPRRVGMIPLEITLPSTVTSLPGCARATGSTVVASS